MLRSSSAKAFSHTFSDVQPGDKIEVGATAYVQQAGRDYMRIRGQWMHSDSPYEEPDRRIVGDAIVFTVYEVPIELRLVRPPDDLDLDSGVLKIRRRDGSTAKVYIDRPGRPGFTITDPDPDGYHRVTYVPRGCEVNPTGTTEVEFTIHDVTGPRHSVAVTIDTP